MSKSKKSFAEKIKEDFKPSAVLEEKEVPGKSRTKAVPGARLIPLSDIHPDPSQPRKKFDKENLVELAESIKSKGVIEPITVRFAESEGIYKIVTGERRFKAAKLAGLAEIPCIVKHLDDQEVLAYQLIENLQREDLSLAEEAKAFRKMLDDGLTQVKLSNLIGKSQPYISQALTILALPQNVLREAEKAGVSKEHLLQLSKAENPEALWEDIKQTGKTAKEVKQQVTKNRPPEDKSKLWAWKPEDKSFTILIRFKKENYKKEELIQVLKKLIQQLAQMELFDSKTS